MRLLLSCARNAGRLDGALSVRQRPAAVFSQTKAFSESPTPASESVAPPPLRFGIEQSDLPDDVSEAVRRVLSLDNANRADVTKARVKKAIEAFQMRPGDTGSSASQSELITTDPIL